ncbi:uncharacterized protein LOC143856494 isoform X4 [Tasmannia lanceolata]|uniref:uncharacterized protein LOC143856494 isoform X4 n=1 Tax=Tasmannia lanceolata TaxID=3420 RepID=UPI00406305B8
MKNKEKVVVEAKKILYNDSRRGDERASISIDPRSFINFAEFERDCFPHRDGCLYQGGASDSMCHPPHNRIAAESEDISDLCISQFRSRPWFRGSFKALFLSSQGFDNGLRIRIGGPL